MRSADEIGKLGSFDGKSYFAQNTIIRDNLNNLIEPDRVYHYKPISKARKAKMNRRSLNTFEIHWRNTELLV